MYRGKEGDDREPSRPRITRSTRHRILPRPESAHAFAIRVKVSGCPQGGGYGSFDHYNQPGGDRAAPNDDRHKRQVHRHGIERTDQFYAETRLPNSERAQLDDYRSSGYDRGHIAPAADMATEDAMAQSFSLANIVPQAPNNHRKTWAKLEKDTRKYVMRAQGEVYVISGPVYDPVPATIGSHHVWVPRYLFKLVYDPNQHRAWAHWIENTDDARIGRLISYQKLVQRTGIEFLPSLL